MIGTHFLQSDNTLLAAGDCEFNDTPRRDDFLRHKAWQELFEEWERELEEEELGTAGLPDVEEIWD